MRKSDIFSLVHKDLDERNRKGHALYGQPCRPFDGRDSLWDAYEEILDLAVYMRKRIEEERMRNPHPGPLPNGEGDQDEH